MKRYLSFPAFVMVFILVAVVAGGTRTHAEDVMVPLIQVEDAVTVSAGTVDVNVTISHNPGILGAILDISYPAELKLDSVRSGAAFSPLTMTKSGSLASPCRFVWDGETFGDEDVQDGVILTMTFLVPEDTQSGTVFPITAICEKKNVIDRNLLPVPVKTAGGSISVISSSDVLPLSASGKIIYPAAKVIVNGQENHSDALLAIATYSDTGKMIGVEMQNVTISAGKNEFQQNLQVEGNYYKAFLLDSDLRPLCESVLLVKEN